MNVGETKKLTVITIYISGNQPLKIFKDDYSVKEIENFIAENESGCWLRDIFGNNHRIHKDLCAIISIESKNVTMKARDSNPFDAEYGEDEIA